MVKSKKTKTDSESILSRKEKVKEKKLNPFEVHLNKEKFTILGRKCKHDRGLPGVSRAKAIKKRKQTLGQEFQDLRKVNKFKDRRIGGNGILDDDALATARFVTAKMTEFKTRKKDKFNLNDEEILTHRGHTLEEIEQFQDPASDDSEDERLDAEFTEAAHFGGGVNEVGDRKAAIEEKIAEAKRKKIETAKEKDEVFELTTKLDSNYKDLIPLMGKLTNKEAQKPPKDDYDRVLKEMIFEPRGDVSDKLETEEELAKKEKERLEKLENERLARMRGEETVDNKPKHKSADDLDDGYFVGSEDEDQGVLAYDIHGKDNEAEDLPSEDEDKKDRSDVKNEDEEETESESEDEEVEDEDDENDEDNLSDLKESESELGEIEENPSKKDSKQKVKQSKNKSLQNLNLKTQASKELPYMYDVPDIYEDLYEILSKQLPDYQQVIVERMIKCNHPKVEAQNKDKMVKLFGFILQYFNDIFSDATEENIEKTFMIFDRLSPHLYDLSHMNPEKTSNCFLEVIKEKYGDYIKNPKIYPTIDFIIFFKLASILFSTSDFRHTVVTPCFIFMTHILSRAQVRTRKDISLGLFIVTIILEYTQCSKRFLPAALNFLRGIIFLSIPKKPIEIIKVVPPFQSIGTQNNILVLSDDLTEQNEQIRMLSKDLLGTNIDNDFKIRALHTALMLLNDLLENLKDNIGTCFLAEPFVELLEKLNLSRYPKFVHDKYQQLQNNLKLIINNPLQRLVAEKKKPKALKLMEPRIERVYDDKRRPKMSKEKEMRAIMLHKVKRETKGAVREIRRDTAFLTKLQIKKQIQSDLERKEKVQRIFSEAAVQQGELNALSRKRKK